ERRRHPDEQVRASRAVAQHPTRRRGGLGSLGWPELADPLTACAQESDRNLVRFELSVVTRCRCKIFTRQPSPAVIEYRTFRTTLFASGGQMRSWLSLIALTLAAPVYGASGVNGIPHGGASACMDAVLACKEAFSVDTPEGTFKFWYFRS